MFRDIGRTLALGLMVIGLLQLGLPGCNGEEGDPDTIVNDDTGVTEDKGTEDPDAEVADPDGEVVDPDGEVVDPDGEVVDPDGEVVDPDGEVVDPDGEVVDPDGEVVDPDGEVVDPDGPAVAPEWTVESADPFIAISDPSNFASQEHQQYTVKNTGTVAFDLSVNVNQHWLGLKTNFGDQGAAEITETLNPNDEIDVIVQLQFEGSPGNEQLPVGLNMDVVTFSNGVDEETRDVELAVYNPGMYWTKKDVVMEPDPGSPDHGGTGTPRVLKMADGTYMMWYVGFGPSGTASILVAQSPDAKNWTKEPTPALEVGAVGEWDGDAVYAPSVVYDEASSTFHMYYAALGDFEQIGHATSADGLTFDKDPANPILSPDGDIEDVSLPSVVWDGTTMEMWYIAWLGALGTQIFYASSTDFVTFNPGPSNPIYEFPEERELMDISVFKDEVAYRLYFIMGEEDKGELETRVFEFSTDDPTDWPDFDDPDNLLKNGGEGEFDRMIIHLSVVREDEFTLSMFYVGTDENEDNWKIARATAAQPGTVEGILTVDPGVTCGTDPIDDCVINILGVIGPCGAPLGCDGGSMFFFQDVDVGAGFPYRVMNAPPGDQNFTIWGFEDWDIFTDGLNTPGSTDLEIPPPGEVTVLSGDTITFDAALVRKAHGPGTVRGDVFIDPGTGYTCDPGDPEHDCVGAITIYSGWEGADGPQAFDMIFDADLSAGPVAYELFDVAEGQAYIAAVFREDNLMALGTDHIPTVRITSLQPFDLVTASGAGPVDFDLPLITVMNP